MIYLKVAHVEDDDVDLYEFKSILSCAEYIHDNAVFNYVISDHIFEEYPEGDYTRMYAFKE
jgi:hypothetical protein